MALQKPYILNKLDTIDTQLADIVTVNVKNFGAKGDGVTDDTTAIINCRNYCHDNKKQMYFPKGTYILNSPIDITKGMIILGEGDNSIIKYNGTGTCINIKLEGSDWSTWTTNFKIINITINGNANADGITINNGYKGVINGCKINNCKYAINLILGWSININKNILNYNKTGIYFNGSSSGVVNAITITGNCIEENTDYGVLLGNGTSATTATYFGGNTSWIQFNTIQMNGISQISINEYIGLFIENNYMETSRTSAGNAIIDVGSVGQYIPREITIRNNVLSEYNTKSSIGIRITMVNTLDIKNNAFWALVTSDVTIIETALSSITNVRFDENNLHFDYNIGGKNFNIVDTQNKIYMYKIFNPTLSGAWTKDATYHSDSITRKYDRVELGGQYNITSLNSAIIFNIPVGLRPVYTKRVLVACPNYAGTFANFAGSYAVAEIRSSGDVRIYNPNTSDGSFPVGVNMSVSLDGISYTI